MKKKTQLFIKKQYFLALKYVTELGGEVQFLFF